MFKHARFKLTEDAAGLKKGQVVFLLGRSDYGSASKEEKLTGVKQTSVTLDDAGDYPFVTVPSRALVKM